MRLQPSWPLPVPPAFGEAGGAGSLPLNLPSLTGGQGYGQHGLPSFAHSLPQPGMGWDLPAGFAQFGGGSTSEAGTSHGLLASSAPAAYPLPSFFNLPPPVPTAPSTGMFAYTSPAGYPTLPYQSYLQPTSAHEYDLKRTSATPDPADINNPRSATYVDQSAPHSVASPFGASPSQAGSEAESWASSHAPSSVSAAHHLRHSSQTSASEGCSPFLGGHYLPQAVPLRQGQGQQGGGQAYGGLGLDVRGGYAGQGQGHGQGQGYGGHDQGGYGSGW